jgi:tricorn protease
MLGVDWALEQGAYRIARIHRGADWEPDARGPLGAPGVDVKEGDWVLAVNGVPLDAAQDPWAGFLGLAGRTAVLTVSSKSVLDEEAREVAVEPSGDEYALRFRSWIERKRRFVEERSGGRLGYVYVTDTGTDGQNDLFRQFYPQIAKEGLIIDERWNGGGQIPTRFIELLNRPATNMWAGRDGKDWHWPPDSHQGPKCMLINGLSGSGGDAFPAYFKHFGLGKLIGMRTWGGLVGISGNPGFVDGGSVTVPTFAYYELDGTWAIEGHGVEPDIEVIDHPTALSRGEDPQLEAAIAHMLDEIAARPWRAPARPAYPDRGGMGLREEDR